MARPVAKTRTSVLVAAAGFGLLAAVTLTACGGSTSETSGAPTTTAPASSNNNNSTATRSFPGASGSVAAITGRSMEVQSQQSGQTTVKWTSATRFTETVKVKESAIAVGDCVTATGTSSGGTVKAKTVSVSKPTSGSCTPAGRSGSGGGGLAGGGGFAGGAGFAGGGGFVGGRGNFKGGPGASKRPTGLADLAFAGGQVTAVSGDQLVLSGYSSSGFKRPGSSSKSTTPTSIAAKTVHVSVSSSTTYSQRKPVASSKLAVGDCVSALGKTDSTGAVSAKTVQITSTGHQSCTGGFGGALFGGGANG